MKFYAYRYRDIDGPVWGPLEQVADRAAKRRDVPTIDVDEFMYMLTRPIVQSDGA